MGGRFFRGIAAAAFCLCAAMANAQTYPNKPIRLVVGFPPGGGIDILARLVGAKMQEALKVPFVVDNRAGATGLLASEVVAKSVPDGYTLLVAASAQMTMNPVLYSNLPYDTFRDFAPITMLAQFPIVIAVHPSVPAKSVQELVALARSRPGVLNYGTGGVGQQIAFEMLKQALAIDIQHIPYKGGAMAVNAAVAGDVQVLVLDIGPAVPHLKSGKLRGLAVTSAERSQIVPELPTVAETVSPGFDMILWVGLFAPSATSASVVATLYKETVNALKFPDIQEKLKGMAMATGGMATERLSALMKSEYAKIGAIVKAANIKAD
jgi:tripartite-type tricarboxylate transporter receptor subunit TctC